ncbi:MAG: hypothetical protein FGM24_07085 [Candidatus Kapabacteria bacterium]|nr:hypothetical protein [Candidatus Kapabacteria bacterium]
MRLVSIHLHPFGKFADVIHEFTSGVHVIEGPNEYGKSTISNAIRHALYTPTSLTPAKMQKAIGEWLPHPNGTHCGVTLIIDNDDVTYTITKVWTKNGSTRLVSTAGDDLVGTAAEERIMAIVGFNEATWEYVFHTSQAALADTVDALRNDGGSMDDLVATTKTTVNDISPERLLSLIDTRITKQYDNWDRNLSLPRGGRGIDNPWKQNVGVILAAYYAWQQAKEQLAELERYTVRVDELRHERTTMVEREAQLDSSVRDGQTLRSALQASRVLQVNVERLTEVVATQHHAYDAWPNATKGVADCSKQIEALSSKLDELRIESEHATTQQSAAALRSAYARILDVKRAVDLANASLQAYTQVTQDTVDKLAGLTQTMRDMDVKIAAHKLAASITSDRDAAIDVTIGSAASERITLSQTEPWSRPDVPGMISFSHDGITVTVKSATGNVAELLDARQAAEHACANILATTGLPTVDAVRDARATYVKHEQALSEQQRLYTQILGDKTFDMWTVEHDALSNLPPSRPLIEVNNEINRTSGDLLAVRSTMQALEQQLDDYAAMYGTREELLDLFTNNRSKLKQAEESLRQLPAIPDGYATADDYLQALDNMEQELHSIRIRRTAIESELQHLQAPKVDMSYGDLRDLVQLQRDAYDRAVSDGQAMYRIRAAAERAAAQQQTSGPLQQLPSLISDLFGRLTHGKYDRIDLDGTAPQHASGTELQRLPVERLSRGTRTSLALATRLALAKAYLQDRHGVIMLDDPFVDMDIDRRRAAMDVLRDVAVDHQVIMFTCHPQS